MAAFIWLSDIALVLAEKLTMQKKSIVISGTGVFCPDQSISNDELVASFNQYADNFNMQHAQAISTGQVEALKTSSSEFIFKASGIKRRQVIDKQGVLDPSRMKPKIAQRNDNELSVQCEMAVAAAREALQRAGKIAADVGAVIVSSSSIERAYPALAIEVQAELGIDGFAYDMNVACSSATFAIQAAYNAIFAGSTGSVLLINPEICSGWLAWQDRDCHFIFGDVCTAMLIEERSAASAEHLFEITGIQLDTKFSNNIRNNFGFLNRCDEEHMQGRDKLFMQNGRRVFKEVCPMVAQHMKDHLLCHSFEAQDVKRFWLHQANINMNELIAKKVLGRAANDDEVPNVLEHYGNTSSAGSILAFHHHHADLLKGDMGMICSFGAGYSVGSVIVKKIN